MTFQIGSDIDDAVKDVADVYSNARKRGLLHTDAIHEASKMYDRKVAELQLVNAENFLIECLKSINARRGLIYYRERDAARGTKAP